MHKVLAAFAYAIFKTLGLLPLSVLQGIGAALGMLGAVLPGSYKERAFENLRIAYPDATPAMNRAAMIQLLQMFLELPYLWAPRNAKKLKNIVQCDRWDLIDTALNQGHGIILISPHVGAFELLCTFYTQRHKAAVIFKEPRMRWFKTLIEWIRNTPSLKLVPANQMGVKSLVKTLLKGDTVGFLPDQVPASGDGVYAPFFGKDAYTMTLVQRMQSIRNSPIFAVGVERLPKGKGYYLHIEPMKEMLSNVPELAATQMNIALEEIIRKMPTQYLWGYDRYKTPRKSRQA